MYTDINSEDRLVQTMFAEHLEQVLGWESVYAWNDETFGPSGTLGRTDPRDGVLTRDLRRAIQRLNPESPPTALDEAIAKLTRHDFSRSLLAQNQSFHKFIREGVPVSFRDATGQLRHAQARVIDFTNGRGSDGEPKNRFLTGFDVECLSTLYIDKPMKAHTLMQAIARANRVYPGKDFGLIVDYNGMLKSLRAALAQYALGEDANGPEEVVAPIEERVGALLDVLDETENHLRGLGFAPNDLVGARGFAKIASIKNGVEAVYLSGSRNAKRGANTWVTIKGPCHGSPNGSPGPI